MWRRITSLWVQDDAESRGRSLRRQLQFLRPPNSPCAPALSPHPTDGASPPHPGLFPLRLWLGKWLWESLLAHLRQRSPPCWPGWPPPPHLHPLCQPSQRRRWCYWWKFAETCSSTGHLLELLQWDFIVCPQIIIVHTARHNPQSSVDGRFSLFSIHVHYYLY